MASPGRAGASPEATMIAFIKPVRRKTCDKFMHYGTPIVVELKPGDCIGLRLLRHKREVVLSLHDLYFEGVRRQVAAERKEKRKHRQTRRFNGRLRQTNLWTRE